MPKDKLTDYDTVNASNTDVGGVNTDEGMLPSAVNNAIREVMTHLKNFASGTDGIDVLSLADDDASHAIKLQAPSSVTADTTFTLPDGDGTDGQVLSTDGSGALSFVNTTPAPNLIINGDFAVSQRGTSFTGSSEYTLDRFYFQRLNTDQLLCTITQDSDAPDGFYNSLKVEVTTAETTLDSDEFTRVFHRLEGQDLQHLQYGISSAKSVTLSFWVKASVTGDYAVLFYRDLTTDRSITKTYTVNSANTWEYKTITIDGDQTTATPSNNTMGLEIDWTLAAGSDYTSTDGTSWGTYVSGKFAYGQTANLIGTANATWQITGVKLEVGSTATPFEHRSYGEELQLCRRYFWTPDNYTNYGGWSLGTSSNYPRCMGDWAVAMRATPTITVQHANNGTANQVEKQDGTGVTPSSYGLTAAGLHWLQLPSVYTGQTQFRYKVDAEL